MVPELPTSLASRNLLHRLKRAQDLSRKMLCGTCHLPDYTGRDQIPRLAEHQEAFLLYAMKQCLDHSGPGRDTSMSASLHGLKDNEIQDLVHFPCQFQVGRPSLPQIQSA